MSETSEVNIVALAGPKLLGCCFNWAMLGVLGVQTYLYHINFPRDPVFLQFLVYGIVIFETIQTGLATGDAFMGFVYQFGDKAALTAMRYEWLYMPVMCSLVSLAVQWFFCWRIYVLGRKRWLAGTIAVISFLQAVSGLIMGILLHYTTVGATSTTAGVSWGIAFAIRFTLGTWVAGSAVADVLIAASMIFIMLRLRSRTRKYLHQSESEARAERMLNKLIQMVVETGALTAGVATLTLILCMQLQGTQYYELTVYILTKLYANTFLANLVNRAFLTRSSECGSSDTSSDLGWGPQVRTTTVALSTVVVATHWPILEAGAVDSDCVRRDRSAPDHSIVPC